MQLREEKREKRKENVINNAIKRDTHKKKSCIKCYKLTLTFINKNKKKNKYYLVHT